MPVISFAEFIKREGGAGGILKLSDKQMKRMEQLASFCENRQKSEYLWLIVNKLMIL